MIKQILKSTNSQINKFSNKNSLKLLDYLKLDNWIIGLLGYSRHQAGFTLIEIMVAATIVALLSTMGISGYQAVTRSSRDALRKSDLEQIRSALEIYKSENNGYPANTSPGSCLPNGLTPNYINNYPADSKPVSYKYCYVYVNNIRYKLCAHLENGSNTPSSSYCDDSVGNICTGNCNYQVTNP